jgi:hypothetical protein
MGVFTTNANTPLETIQNPNEDGVTVGKVKALIREWAAKLNFEINETVLTNYLIYLKEGRRIETNDNILRIYYTYIPAKYKKENKEIDTLTPDTYRSLYFKSHVGDYIKNFENADDYNEYRYFIKNPDNSYSNIQDLIMNAKQKKDGILVRDDNYRLIRDTGKQKAIIDKFRNLLDKADEGLVKRAVYRVLQNQPIDKPLDADEIRKSLLKMNIIWHTDLNDNVNKALEDSDKNKNKDLYNKIKESLDDEVNIAAGVKFSIADAYNAVTKAENTRELPVIDKKDIEYGIPLLILNLSDIYDKRNKIAIPDNKDDPDEKNITNIMFDKGSLWNRPPVSKSQKKTEQSNTGGKKSRRRKTKRRNRKRSKKGKSKRRSSRR